MARQVPPIAVQINIYPMARVSIACITQRVMGKTINAMMVFMMTATVNARRVRQTVHVPVRRIFHVLPEHFYITGYVPHVQTTRRVRVAPKHFIASRDGIAMACFVCHVAGMFVMAKRWSVVPPVIFIIRGVAYPALNVILRCIVRSVPQSHPSHV